MGKIQDIMEQITRRQTALGEQELKERLPRAINPTLAEAVKSNPELGKEISKEAEGMNERLRHKAIEVQKIGYKSFATKIKFGDLILELNDSFEDLELELNEEDEYNDNPNSPLE